MKLSRYQHVSEHNSICKELLNGEVEETYTDVAD